MVVKITSLFFVNTGYTVITLIFSQVRSDVAVRIFLDIVYDAWRSRM